jgi:hypothetical protein
VLDGNSQATLFRQAAFLKGNPSLTVTIEGNVLLGDTCKEIGVTRHTSDNAATALTA